MDRRVAPTDLWGITWTSEDINDPGFGVMLGGIRVSESSVVPLDTAIRDSNNGYPRFWVNPYNRYGERAGLYELGRKSPLYTRHMVGVIEGARDRRRRGK